MQNRYVADIGDFGKFQLFRFLFNTPSPLADNTLAQIWFLHENEESNNDGKHINYFERVKGSDEALEAIMIDIIQEDFVINISAQSSYKSSIRFTGVPSI